MSTDDKTRKQPELEPTASLPVGARCRWFRNGDLDEAPIPAMVNRSRKTGILGLTVFTPGSQSIQDVSSARHVSHPDVHLRPYLLDDPRVGLWDYVPGQLVIQGDRLMLAIMPGGPVCKLVRLDVAATRIPELAFRGGQPSPTHSREEQEAKVLELAQKYGPASSARIAEEVSAWGGEAWNHQRVSQCIRKRSKLAATTE